MSNQDDQKKKPSGPPHVSDLILGSMKPRTGRETSKWIAGLADNTVRDAAEAASREIDAAQTPAATGQPLKQSAAKQAVVMFTDQIFDHFQQYEYDFNHTVAGTDYVISIERPVFSNEQVRQRFGAPESVKVFKGRVSTRYWTLIIRAYNAIIECWVLPVEQNLSFRADDERYPPYISIEPMASRTGDLLWKVNGSHVAGDQVRVLAREIFTSLIRRARGEMAENEQFSVNASIDQRITGEFATSSNSGGYNSLAQSGQHMIKPVGPGDRRSIPLGSEPLQGQTDRRPFDSGTDLQTPGKSPKQTMRNTRKQAAQQGMQQPELQGGPAMPPSSPSMPQSSQPMPLASQHMLQGGPPMVPGPLGMTGPMIAPQPPGAPADMANRQPGGPTVDYAIASLNAVIMRELSILSAKGADAFAKQDMVMVDKIVQKTNKVRDLHNQINQLLEQWKKAFEDAIEP